MSNKNKECPHGQKNSCPKCSQVKMVAYLEDDTRIVWYSFFKDEKKFKNKDSVSVQMGNRITKNYGEKLKKLMFFDNTTGAKDLIAEN